MKKKIRYILLIVSLMLFKFNNVLAFKNYDGGKNTKSCGGGLIKDIPSAVPRAINIFYIGLQIVTPIILVIFGIIDLIKAISAGKEDEIKSAQMTFVRRLLNALLIFFVFTLVKTLIYFVGDGNKSAKIVKCMNCFINNSCK